MLEGEGNERLGKDGWGGTSRPVLCCLALIRHGKWGLPYEWRMLL